MSRRRVPVALLVSAALLTSAAACGDDDGDDETTPPTSAETSGTTTPTVTTLVPRSDNDEELTRRFVDFDGYDYSTAAVDDEFVFPAFAPIIAIEASAEVLERYAVRLVADDGEGFALLLIGTLAPDFQDERGIEQAFAQRQRSRTIEGRNVFFERVATQTELGQAFRFTWTADGFLYVAYGEDPDHIEAFIGGLLTATADASS